MKPLLNFFLSLCLVLFGAYGHSYAGEQGNYAGHHSIKAPAWAHHAHLAAPQDIVSLVFTTSPIDNETEDERIIAPEAEDEDEESSKKRSICGNYFARFYSSSSHLNFNALQKARSASTAPPSHTSSCRYILFQVFRI
jgi:hypothetical protein